MGPVEQAQIVSSTAVIVSLGTIIGSMLLTNQEPRLMDFVSVLTVGLIGFTSVYFTLSYARQLDEERHKLLTLNTVAAAVNRDVQLDPVLTTALARTVELLNTKFGWIYMREGNRLMLKCSRGTSFDILSSTSLRENPAAWLHQPRVLREESNEQKPVLAPEITSLGIRFLASIPLKSKDAVVGTLIVAGDDFGKFSPKQADLMEAFANQISVAVGNAQLFERVKQSEQRYADLFEHSPDVYLTVNRDHTMVSCNTTGATMLGFFKDELIGKPFESLFLPDRREHIHERVTRMFAESSGIKDLEEQLQTKSGETLFASINSTLVFDEAGTTVGSRVVARDISERKKMEGALLHAQKIDSIGNLAGGIAHDFNNILASILGSASIMRRRMAEDDKLYKYVEITEVAARRGSSLTRQLLTFARKTDTNEKTVDMNSLINETIQLFERSVSKNILIERRLTTESALVSGDEGQVQQAILNLLLNARDAMPDGGTVTISTAVTVADAHSVSQFLSVKPGPYIEVRVSDTGTGMDRKTQGRIFEPFYTTKDNGTGLGLSVLYGVVRNHGGFVNLESEVGRGTTFSLFFPRCEAKAIAARKQRQQRLPRGKEHILIMEDEESVSVITRDLLADLGYTVFVVHDGQAGVEMYRTRQASVDLVILDMNMPLMSGKEAFEILRKINPHVKIIVLTGYGKKILDHSTFSGAVNGYIQKPFQPEELATKVRLALDSRMMESEYSAS